MSLWKTWQLSQRTFASQQGCSHILLLRWPNKTNKQTFCWLWVCEGRGNCHKGICIKTATLTNPSHKVSKQNKQSFCPPPLRIFLPFYGPVMYLLIVSLWKTWQLSRRTFASQQVCSLILLITKQTNNPPRIFLPSYTPVMYLLIVNLWKTWQLSRRTLASPFMKPLHFLFNLFYCLPAQTKQTKFCPPPLGFSYLPTALSCICWSWVCERRDNCQEGHLHRDLWSRCISCSICFAACPIQFSRDVTLINLIKREEEKENACSLSHNAMFQKKIWSYFWIMNSWSVQMLLLKDFKSIVLCTASKESNNLLSKRSTFNFFYMHLVGYPLRFTSDPICRNKIA